MKKKLNLAFYENIIAFDFFLINQCKNLKNFENISKIHKKKYYTIDLQILIKELKQFVHVLKFFSKKVQGRQNVLYFLLQNRDFQVLTRRYFRKKSDVQIRFMRRYTHTTPSFEYKKMFVSDCFFKNKNIESIMLYDNIFLSTIIQQSLFSKYSSVYSIYNSLDNIKKLYFFLALIKLTCINKKKNVYKK